jgi:hypothetical protein
MAKNRKPLTPREQLKNLTDAMAEDSLTDRTPLTERETAEAERMKKNVLEKVEARRSDWQDEEGKRKAGRKTNYIN